MYLDPHEDHAYCNISTAHRPRCAALHLIIILMLFAFLRLFAIISHMWDWLHCYTGSTGLYAAFCRISLRVLFSSSLRKYACCIMDQGQVMTKHFECRTWLDHCEIISRYCVETLRSFHKVRVIKSRSKNYCYYCSNLRLKGNIQLIVIRTIT